MSRTQLRSADLVAEIEALKARLAEAEDTLGAIRQGDVDALVVGERVYLLEGLEAASNRFRGEVIAQIDDAVIAIDTEQRVTYFNAAAERQYGIPASQALGYPLSAIYEYRWPHPGDEARAAQALQERGAWRGRNVHLKKDGTQIHVESAVSVLRDAGGAQIGLLAVVRDVTERVNAERAAAEQRRAAEEASREADRRKDEFLATLAHELRNPLAPIRNALHIMQLTGDAAIHENARRIIGRQLQQMVHLVDDLLDVSRISQGKVELRRRHVDIAAAVQIAVETSRPLIDAGKHHLTLHAPPPGTLVVDADLTRLSQVIANLLNNAAKYTPEGGDIEVSVERDGPHAAIAVQDSGVGIPREMIPRVFDMFAQVDRSLERAQGGLGIGLALVKQLVEMHGGSVAAQSDGAGHGSRFVVRMPLVLAGDVDAAHERDGATRAGHGAGMHVLVADDNVDSADSLAQMLRLLGYRTSTAHDGIEAFRIAQAERPRAALLDIGMPRLSGIDVARRIRAEPWGSAVLLIALSGWGQDDDRHRSLAAGFDRHFVKPVEVDALTQLLSLSLR
jgi:PAS domain S-box-containing protein